MDSAAVGYAGNNPETASGATIGNITKMWIEFDIYKASSCGSGIPVASPRAQVYDTGALGDGMGMNQASDVERAIELLLYSFEIAIRSSSTR